MWPIVEINNSKIICDQTRQWSDFITIWKVSIQGIEWDAWKRSKNLLILNIRSIINYYLRRHHPGNIYKSYIFPKLNLLDHLSYALIQYNSSHRIFFHTIIISNAVNAKILIVTSSIIWPLLNFHIFFCCADFKKICFLLIFVISRQGKYVTADDLYNS